MKSFLKNYFTFNKGDRNAFLILLTILLIIVVIPFISKYFYKEKIYDFTAYRNEILAFELAQNLKQKEDSIKKIARQTKQFDYIQIYNSVEQSKLHPFTFNPNNLPAEQWRKMGFSDRQINGIKNFEAKGGRFYAKSDVRKLYVISESEYEILEPFIDLPTETTKKKYQSPPKVVVEMIELNNADSVALKKLKGIGNAISKRIVRYRTKLGGFYKKEQLLEVSGIDSSLFKTIEPYLTLEKRLIRKIDINTAEFKDLKGHPYLSSNIALSIINYRTTHGKYKVLTDIMKSALVTEELFYKITPYITIESL